MERAPLKAREGKRQIHENVPGQFLKTVSVFVYGRYDSHKCARVTKVHHLHLDFPNLLKQNKNTFYEFDVDLVKITNYIFF